MSVLFSASFHAVAWVTWDDVIDPPTPVMRSNTLLCHYFLFDLLIFLVSYAIVSYSIQLILIFDYYFIRKNMMFIELAIISYPINLRLQLVI